MNEQPSTARIALKWGALLGVASILLSAVMFLTESTDNRWLSILTYVFIVVGLVLAMRDYKSLNGGYMSYGDGVGVGTLTAAISGFISSMFSVFYTTVIDSGIMLRAADRAREQLEDQGFSDEQIDRQLEFVRLFQSPGLLFVIGILGSVLMGLIFSLIIAAFIRRNRNNPFE